MTPVLPADEAPYATLFFVESVMAPPGQRNFSAVAPSLLPFWEELWIVLVLALLRALEEADAPAPFLPSGDTLSPRDLFVAEVTCIWFVLELV